MFEVVRMEDISEGKRLIVTVNHYGMVELRIEEDSREDIYLNLEPSEATALAAALDATATEIRARGKAK